ncbi:MAG: hypothetical protein Q4P18_08140 [Methanobrevibacter sp.]|uniref:hypothetical protein n=1 Tax=Methanobrevibacter sp. TaxID=66852 RepID=UPI0026E0D1F0|nr:hypothetical protein [Methanobrevibacter sp.]MDO5849491.1 hypothetical protein [Methanobrevibacter sp.]
MLKVMSHRRRLLRKNMYKAPHTRHEKNIMSGSHIKKHNKPKERPNFKFKKKPVRRVNKGYKMSYRYKYYNNDVVEEDENVEESQ